MPVRLSLAIKIFAPTFVVAGLSFAAATFVADQTAAKMIRRSVEARAEALTAQIRHGARAGTLAGSLEDIATRGDVIDVVVLDARGRRVAGLGAEAVQRPLPRGRLARPAPTGGLTFKDGAREAAYAAPVALGPDQRNGTVVLRLRTDREAAAERSLSLAILLGAAATGLAALATALGSYWLVVGRRMRRMLAVVEARRSGDADAFLNFDEQDEVGATARQLDRLFADLDARIADQARTAASLRSALAEASALRTALEAHASIVIADPTGVILDANPLFERLSGYTREEVVGRSLKVLRSDFHGPGFFAAIFSTLMRGEVWQGDACNRGKDRLYWTRTTAYAVPDETGRPERFVLIGADISEARATLAELEDERARLARSHEMLQEMQALSAVGAAEIDVATGATWFSDETYRIFGLTPGSEATAWTMAGMVSEEDREIFVRAFRRCARDGTAFDLERRFLTGDGQQRWIRFRVRREGDAETGRLIGAVQDVSDRKRTEEELAAAGRRAEDANAAKSAFLANMSHEIRTPLNGVIGLTGALARTELTASQREIVELVQSSGQVLERLLSDILDLSKVEAGKLQLEVAAFDLKDEIESAAHLMRVRAQDKGVGFRVEYGETARGIFEGDAVRVKQIVANLASNAVKFTDAGEVLIRVDAVEPGPDEDAPTALTIRVRDTGVGFDSEAAKRLFQRFEQADGSITRQFGGTGLGLAICKALSELMGGSISAVSEPGRGSEFTVELALHRTMPLKDYDRRGGDQGKDAESDPVGFGSGTRLKVLLAEDHPTNQKVVELILAPYDVDLTVVSDGAQALERLRQESFDLVLMDMQMPVMDGLEATRALRALEAETGRPRTPLAMLTANAMQEHRDRAALAGADAYIAKPVTPQSLLAGMDMALALGAVGDFDTDALFSAAS